MSVDRGAQSYVDGNLLLSAACVLGALDVLAVGLRLAARRVQRVGLGADDWLIIPAMLLVVGMAAVMISAVELKTWGFPTPEDPYITETSLKLEYIFQLLMIPSYGFLKLSVISFYRRVFVSEKGSAFDLACWVLFGICIAWMVGFFFLFAFSCGGHVETYWLPATEGYVYGKCLPPFPPEEGLITSDLITDLAVLALPFPMIWRLHMTTARKISVTAILLLACLSVIASIIRMVYYYQIFANYYSDTNADLNLTLARAFYWSMIEAGLGVFAACLPTLRIFVGRAGLQSIVRSVRSAVSLSSLRSGGGGSGGHPHKDGDSLAPQPQQQQQNRDAPQPGSARGSSPPPRTPAASTLHSEPPGSAPSRAGSPAAGGDHAG